MGITAILRRSKVILPKAAYQNHDDFLFALQCVEQAPGAAVRSRWQEDLKGWCLDSEKLILSWNPASSLLGCLEDEYVCVLCRGRRQCLLNIVLYMYLARRYVHSEDNCLNTMRRPIWKPSVHTKGIVSKMNTNLSIIEISKRCETDSANHVILKMGNWKYIYSATKLYL